MYYFLNLDYKLLAMCIQNNIAGITNSCYQEKVKSFYGIYIDYKSEFENLTGQEFIPQDIKLFLNAKSNYRIITLLDDVLWHGEINKFLSASPNSHLDLYRYRKCDWVKTKNQNRECIELLKPLRYRRKHEFFPIKSLDIIKVLDKFFKHQLVS